MLIQIDDRNIINPDRIVHIVCEEITIENEYIPFEEIETHVVRIYFGDNDFIDCDIKLSLFSAKMQRCKEE